MPYRVFKEKSGYFVKVKRGGKWVKKNKKPLTKAKAQAYQRALYANTKD
jgi:hypothetical protein